MNDFDRESAYFGKAGALAGGIISALFFNFPIVRYKLQT